MLCSSHAPDIAGIMLRARERLALGSTPGRLPLGSDHMNFVDATLVQSSVHCYI